MTGKMHTRAKRKYGRSTHRNAKDIFGKPRQTRPKTFHTEQKAKEYAKVLGLKEGQYLLEKAKKGRKFKVVKK